MTDTWTIREDDIDGPLVVTGPRLGFDSIRVVRDELQEAIWLLDLRERETELLAKAAEAANGLDFRDKTSRRAR